MTDGTISIWKAEEFLIDNLKEISKPNGEFEIKAGCSLREFLERFENYVKNKG